MIVGEQAQHDSRGTGTGHPSRNSPEQAQHDSIGVQEQHDIRGTGTV